MDNLFINLLTWVTGFLLLIITKDDIWKYMFYKNKSCNNKQWSLVMPQLIFVEWTKTIKKNIYIYIFHWTRKVIQVWKDMRVIKWWLKETSLHQYCWIVYNLLTLVLLPNPYSFFLIWNIRDVLQFSIHWKSAVIVLPDSKGQKTPYKL